MLVSLRPVTSHQRSVRRQTFDCGGVALLELERPALISSHTQRSHKGEDDVMSFVP